MSISRVWITCVDRQPMHEHVEHRALDRVGVEPCDIVRLPCGSRSMQGREALLREGDTEIERRRRLRDAALLVRERDHLRLCRALPLRGGRADIRPRNKACEGHVDAPFALHRPVPSRGPTVPVACRRRFPAAPPLPVRASSSAAPRRRTRDRRPRRAPRPRPRGRAREAPRAVAAPNRSRSSASMHHRLQRIFELCGGDPRGTGRLAALHLAARMAGLP